MIPQGFTVCGTDISVELVPLGRWHEIDPKMESCGMYVHSKQAIYIRDDLPEQLAQQTWVHEAEHCVLTIMGHELNTNEEFIDLHSSLWHQILVTMHHGVKPRNKRK